MNEINHGDKPFLADDKKDGLGLTLEKKEKAPLTDEQLAVKEANRQKAAIYKERRIALGLSQKQLAQKTGVSYNSIQGMEKVGHVGKPVKKYGTCWECQKNGFTP